MPNGGRPDNIGRPVWIISSTVLIFLISQAIAAFAVGLVYGIIRHGKYAELTDSIVAQFFYILIAEGLAAWSAIKLVRWKGLGLSFIGLGRRPRVNDLYKAALGFMVFYGLLIAAGILISLFSPDWSGQKQNLGFNNISTRADNLLAFLALVVVPPLGEEILLRGYLYSGLRRFWRFWPALLVTSLIFGVAHLEFGSGGPLVWGAAVDTFLLSVVLVYLRERTGALYAGMLVHMANNLIAFTLVIK